MRSTRPSARRSRASKTCAGGSSPAIRCSRAASHCCRERARRCAASISGAASAAARPSWSDAFFAELPIREKRREHFHRFMQDVHARLAGTATAPRRSSRSPRTFAAKARVLCIDEFIVGDVADAMILGTLLEALFRRGVTLLATSNLPPGELYRGGLQRERFLPAIALDREALPRHRDRRRRRLSTAAARAGDALARAGGHGRRCAPGGRIRAPRRRARRRDVKIQVEGRPVRARREAEDVVWFEFRELCEGPRSAADYIEIARCYQAVFLSRVPVMGAADDDAARRFISLVDEFYDRGVKLVCPPPPPRPGRSTAANAWPSSSGAPRAACTRCRAAPTSRSRTGPDKRGRSPISDRKGVRPLFYAQAAPRLRTMSATR